MCLHMNTSEPVLACISEHEQEERSSNQLSRGALGFVLPGGSACQLFPPAALLFRTHTARTMGVVDECVCDCLRACPCVYPAPAGGQTNLIITDLTRNLPDPPNSVSPVPDLPYRQPLIAQ